MATKKQTPAQRARARRDPAIFSPPPNPVGALSSSVRNLNLRIAGRTYPISDNLDGDTPWAMGMDQTGQVTVPVRDPSGWVPRVIDDESLLMQGGVALAINGVNYVASGLDFDGLGLYTFTFSDEVSERLKLFSTYRSASRARTTRYGFINTLLDEAERKPFEKLRRFIPEIDDKQPILKAKKTTT